MWFAVLICVYTVVISGCVTIRVCVSRGWLKLLHLILRFSVPICGYILSLSVAENILCVFGQFLHEITKPLSLKLNISPIYLYIAGFYTATDT